jgi:hypothetical protein
MNQPANRAVVRTAQANDHPPSPQGGSTMSDDLVRLARLADDAGAPELAADATALAERLAEGRFYVACVGQFKRGKSTLLNALVGQRLLPAGIVPITTAVTVLRWGPAPRARVHLDRGWHEIATAELAAYVSEAQNPANRKGVTLVEVFVPSPLLQRGMCLVDTPGIGSVIRANTDVTRQFVPQIDAALVVLGVDPPISGDELALVEQAAAQVATLVFVLNKADRSPERERDEAIAFARRVLTEHLGRDIGAVYEVSALEVLDGGGARFRDWGMLEHTLRTLADSAGGALIGQAASRGVRRLADRLLHDVCEQRDALTRPVAESERHVADLRACVADTARALNDLGYLFTAEQKRLSDRFSEQWNAFVSDASPKADAELRAALRAVSGSRAEMRRSAFTAARTIGEQSVTRWLADSEPIAERFYRQAAERFANLANDLLQRLAASDRALSALPTSVSPDLGFRTGRRFFQTDLIHHVTRTPLQVVLDALRPPAAARRALEREVCDYLGLLISANAARAINDFDERVLESRRRLEGEIRACLEQITASAERALARARERHAAGREAVEADIERLDGLRAAVEAIRARAGAVGDAPAAPAPAIQCGG